MSRIPAVRNDQEPAPPEVSACGNRAGARDIHHSRVPSSYGHGMPRPKTHHEERVTTALRVPKPLHERLKEAAADRQVGVNLLAVTAIEDYLSRLIPVEELKLTR
jgi:hypothetical protein